MRLVTVIIVVVALVISGVTTFLILRFLQSQSAQPVAEHELVPAERVLVAKVDLGSRALLDEKEHFAWQAWPRDGVALDYVTEASGKADEFVGADSKTRDRHDHPCSTARILLPPALTGDERHYCSPRYKNSTRFRNMKSRRCPISIHKGRQARPTS